MIRWFIRYYFNEEGVRNSIKVLQFLNTNNEWEDVPVVDETI